MKNQKQLFNEFDFLLYKVLPLVPKYRIFVDLNAGGSFFTFILPPYLIENFNDISSSLFNLFYVMRDDSLYNSFVEKSKNNDFVLDKGLFLIEKIDDKVDFALEFYKRVDFIFNELQNKNIHLNIPELIPNMLDFAKQKLTIINNFYNLYNRVMRMQIEHDTIIKNINRYDTEDTFFYLEFPSEIHFSLYKNVNECFIYQEKDIINILNLLKAIKGKFIGIIDRSPIYENILENINKEYIILKIKDYEKERIIFYKI